MAIWDKLKDGIDKASKVAQDAVDEGKTRLDARKARQAADQAAESLGYAVYRAWQNARSLDEQSLERLARALRDHEQEAVRLEAATTEAAEWRRRTGAADPSSGAAAADSVGAAPSEPGPSAPETPPAASGQGPASGPGNPSAF